LKQVIVEQVLIGGVGCCGSSKAVVSEASWNKNRCLRQRKGVNLLCWSTCQTIYHADGNQT
jgi:hypothetical protein